MKYFLIALIFCFQTSFAQVDSVTNIQELGWRISLPPGFKSIDSATLGAEYRSLKKIWVKKVADSNYNQFVFTARDSIKNTFSIYYIDSVHDKLNGDFSEDAYSGIITIKKTKSTITYDGVKFNKLQINGNPRPGVSYMVVMLKTRYKGKTFNINYTYNTQTIGNEIEQMLITSKFDRQ